MLAPEDVYHIYNCANGTENLFREERNYHFFLEKYFKYAHPIAETFAYCLMPNHFHIMVRIRSEEDLTGFENLSGLAIKKFGNLFNSYAKAYNKTYNRRGSLFMRPFKKKKVKNEAYFTRLILYIHNNPVKHGFVKNMWDWPYSSLHLFAADNKAIRFGSKFKELLNRKEVIDWFGGLQEFRAMHEEVGELKLRSVFD